MSDLADPFTAVIDTNVLAAALKRNIVLSLAARGLFRPCWSARTIDAEFERALVNMGVPPDKARRQRDNVLNAFPEGRINEDLALTASLALPDPDDVHVFSAAIHRRAAVIVTDNLSDFPAQALRPYEIEPISADGFIADCIDMAGLEAVIALRTMRERFDKPAIDGSELLRMVEANGLAETATLLAPYRTLL